MIDIPALHNAADDQPLRFTPVCSRTAIPVCLNPAYAGDLPVVTNALAPLLDQLAGLPGAPSRILQVAVSYRHDTVNGISTRPGAPQVSGMSRVFPLVLPDQLPGPSMTVEQLAGQIQGQAAQSDGPNLVARLVDYQPGESQAQDAVAKALLLVAAQQAGPAAQAASTGPGQLDANPWPDLTPGTAVYAAAERFAALSAPARHAWLVQHLAPLRAGRITLAQIP
jgi:hypothetical protein